jgi:hypothetical protein
MNLSTPLQNSESTDSSQGTIPEGKEAQAIVSWVNEQFMKMKNARVATERQWYINLAFYFGKQNVQFLSSTASSTSSQSLKLYTPPAPYYKARPVTNLIRPRLRKEMAKLTAQKPNVFVVPSSSDERDLYAAQAGENIWEYVYDFQKVAAHIRRAIFWTSITGNGFIKNWWDPEKPDIFSDQNGDICFESLTPFHLFVPDLRQEEIEDQPFIMHAMLRNAEELSMAYGQDIKFSNNDSDKLEDSFLNVMGLQEWEKNKNVFVQETWIKPGRVKKFPDGGLITVAGNKVISFQEGQIFAHNRFPVAHIGNIPTGKFYRDSIINDLIPLQREYNRTRGQIIESKNRMAKPQLAAEIGSIDTSKVTSEPGQIILYRPGFQAPTPIPLQSIPSYVLQELDRIRNDMDELSGQFELTDFPGVTAATAISYLQEQSESQLAYTFDSIEEAIEKLGYMTLNYVKAYWDTARKVKITGTDGTFDVATFEGSDLRDNTDVRCEAGSALPTSRAAKQAFIMDLMKFGFIDPQKGLEVMEIGGVNKIYEQIQVDIRQAQRENLKMGQATADLIAQSHQEQLDKYMQTPEAQNLAAQGLIMEGPNGDLMDLSDVLMGGQPKPVEVPLLVPVNTWDDHRLHIERHNNYRKSQSFDNLPDEAKTLFEEHVKQHVAAIMVGAAGALPPEFLDPAMMDQINSNMQNPEAVKEMEHQAQPEQTSNSATTPNGMSGQ